MILALYLLLVAYFLAVVGVIHYLERNTTR